MTAPRASPPTPASSTVTSPSSARSSSATAPPPALFPELAANPVFLAGESYAGVYLPTLAQAILHDEPKVDLRGVWVTDPCTDNAAQSGYLDIGVRFSCDKGLITPELRDTLLAKPCTTGTTQVGDLVRGNSTAACRAAWRLYDIATAGVGDAVHPTAINGLPMYAEESSSISYSLERLTYALRHDMPPTET